ncbi:hypothetical protein DFH08DRAFT_823103 [Mycena albidolilacea]|uniref:Cytochrome P450 n=1 Tax=Mycena albidolilacea TaxID=1033008 RepID=A0AAD7EBJ0_9AGAR|nr:hypothetical protein DFH08DRAFT_823103 [Mycena albidolilacea]
MYREGEPRWDVGKQISPEQILGKRKSSLVALHMPPCFDPQISPEPKSIRVEDAKRMGVKGATDETPKSETFGANFNLAINLIDDVIEMVSESFSLSFNDSPSERQSARVPHAAVWPSCFHLHASLFSALFLRFPSFLSSFPSALVPGSPSAPAPVTARFHLNTPPHQPYIEFGRPALTVPNFFSPNWEIPLRPQTPTASPPLSTPAPTFLPTMTRSKRKAAFERSIPDYRRRILVSLTKTLFFPPLLSLAALCLVLGLSVNRFTLAAAILSIPLIISTRSFISLRSQDRTAKHLNAQIFADLLREHNTTTVNTRLFWDDQIITMDERVTKFVSSTGFSHFEKSILWHERIDKLLGTGIFDAEGDLWKTGRATARPFFAKERISDFEIFERTSATTLNLIVSRSHECLPINIQDLVARFTLDSASEFLFGVELGTLSRPLTIPGKVKLGPQGSVPIDGATEFDEFTEAYERVAVIITRRGTQAILGHWGSYSKTKPRVPLRPL